MEKGKRGAKAAGEKTCAQCLRVCVCVCVLGEGGSPPACARLFCLREPGRTRAEQNEQQTPVHPSSRSPTQPVAAPATRQVYRLLHDADVGDALVGREVFILWPDDGTWYSAEVDEVCAVVVVCVVCAHAAGARVRAGGGGGGDDYPPLFAPPLLNTFKHHNTPHTQQQQHQHN